MDGLCWDSRQAHEPRGDIGAPKVLVTGAETHQGLAVIRGLAGVPVVACGAHRRSLGFLLHSSLPKAELDAQR